MAFSAYDDANVFHRAMRGLAGTKAGRVMFRSTAHHLDGSLSRLTRGRRTFGGIAAGLPTIILTTTGARSGKPRTIALLGIPHREGIAVIAANYGGTRHPGWYHNLKANPAAQVTMEGQMWDAEARLATPDEEEDIWAQGLALYPGLAKERVWAGDRQIKAFVLRRV
jgi:deazaflavin-dependent oxidoreductase (nitroreductase family)